jgi:hypothetical protein
LHAAQTTQKGGIEDTEENKGRVHSAIHSFRQKRTLPTARLIVTIGRLDLEQLFT